MSQTTLKTFCLSWLIVFGFVFLWANRRDFVRHLNRFATPGDEWKWKAEQRWTIEEILLLFSFYAIPFGYAGMFVSGGGKAGAVTIAKLFLLACMFFWFFNSVFVRKDSWFVLSFFNHRTSVLLLLYLAVNFASLVNVENSMLFYWVYLQTGLIVVLYFLVVNIIRYKRRMLLWMVYATIIGSLWSALGGIYELVTGDLLLKGKARYSLNLGGGAGLTQGGKGYDKRMGGGRIGGFSGNVGGHGFKYAIWTTLACCLPLIAKSRTGKILGLLYIAIALINVFGSGTKTAIIGLFCGMSVFFALGHFRKKWLYVLSIALFVVIFVATLPPPMRARLLNKSNMSKASLDLRYPQYKTALHMVKAHPILGIGTGQYMEQCLHYGQQVPKHSRTAPSIVHNGFLQIWAENGTLGFTFLLAVFLSGIAAMVKGIRDAPDREMRELSVSILGAFVAWMVMMLAYPTVLDEMGWVLIGMSTCIAFIYAQESGEEKPNEAAT